MENKTHTSNIAITCDDKHLASLLDHLTSIIGEQTGEYLNLKTRFENEQNEFSKLQASFKEIELNLSDCQTQLNEKTVLYDKLASEKSMLKSDYNQKIIQLDENTKKLTEITEYINKVNSGVVWLPREVKHFRRCLDVLGKSLTEAKVKLDEIPSEKDFLNDVDFDNQESLNAFVERCKNGINEGFIFLCNVSWWYVNDVNCNLLESVFYNVQEVMLRLDDLLAFFNDTMKWNCKFPDNIFGNDNKQCVANYQSASEKCKWYSVLFANKGNVVESGNLCEIMKMADDNGQLGLLRSFLADDI